MRGVVAHMESVDGLPKEDAESHKQLHTCTQGRQAIAAGLEKLVHSNEQECPAQVPEVGS